MADLPRDHGWGEENDRIAKEKGHASWAAWCDAIEEKKGRKICGGRNSKNMPCAQPAGGASPSGKKTNHVGKGRCGAHGGLSPMGQHSPHYKHGQKSRYLKGAPQYLKDAADEVTRMRDLWSELDLMRARVLALITTDPERPTTPAALREAADKAIKAAGSATTAEQLRAVAEEFIAALAPMSMEMASWEESVGLIESIRKVFETQLKTEQAAFAPMSEVREFFLLERIKKVILDNVSDASARANIANEFAALQVEFLRPGESVPDPEGMN